MDFGSVGGITLTVDGLASLLGLAVGGGIAVGAIFVVVTLFYGRR